MAKLGPEGLKKAEKELEEAKAEHDKPIPTEILLDFAVPSVKSIAFIPVQSLQEQGTGRAAPTKALESEILSEHVQSDGSAVPFFVQYDHVEVSHSAPRLSSDTHKATSPTLLVYTHSSPWPNSRTGFARESKSSSR